MAKFITLFSGSSGNCSLVTDGAQNLLIDMGRSCRQTLESLRLLGKTAKDITAVLITHEHTDHVSGLRVFLEKNSVPVYGPARTLDYLFQHAMIPARASRTEVSGSFRIGDICVRAFHTEHDSVDCTGYRMDFSNGRSLSVATDLGYVSEDVYATICGSHLVALESNYDEMMLQNGSYPFYLKSRIRSMAGHLCNDECASAAALFAQTGTEKLVLMHLSEENNDAGLALTTCLSALENHGITQDAMRVFVAPRHAAGDWLEV